MITLRRDGDRAHERRRLREAWHTFLSDAKGSSADGFGAIEGFDEVELRPGGRIPSEPRGDAEIVTYVLEGTLALDDPLGAHGLIQAGEFHRMAGRSRGARGPINASRMDRAHVFRIRLRSLRAGLDPGQEQRRFSAAERRGVLCLVGSADGRRGSLRIHQEARIYSALLYPGQHVIHELGAGRMAWLHVVSGEATTGDLVLTTGDGLGVVADRVVSLTARESSEVLLIDVADEPPMPPAVAPDR